MIKNKCSLFALSLLVSGTVSSAPPQLLDKDGPICTSFLCAFKGPGGFYADLTGYYLRPSETGIGLVTDSWQYPIPGGELARSKPFQPKHKFAGRVALGYDFVNSANNIEVSYFGFSNRTHAVNDFSDGSNFFGSVLFPDATIPPTPGFVSNAHLRYKLNQIDLKLGRKYRDTGGQFSIRSSAGVRFADLEHKLTFAAPGNMISKFKGAGPLFSLEANYGLARGFGLVGYFDYALIVGQIDSHSYVNLQNFNYKYLWPKNDRVVNSITGKLGVDFSHVFSNTANVRVEAGYQVGTYISSMDTLRGYVFSPGFQHIAGKETNDFSYRGPYLTLAMHA